MLFWPSTRNAAIAGGDTNAETEDHWPSRSVFDDRKWPEGFVFPACVLCNAATAVDETLFALICRLGKPPNSANSTDQTIKLLAAVKETLPAVFQTLRTFVPIPSGPLQTFGPKLAPLNNSGLPYAVSIDHPNIRDRMARCITKLLFSLHYRHTGSIVPKDGGAVWEWFTNANSESKFFFDSAFAALASKRTKIKWQKNDLDFQFYYEYGNFGGPGSASASVFRISIHSTVRICGFIFDDLGYLADSLPMAKLSRPFTHIHA